MEASTGNLTQEKAETTAGKDPASVYSLNFTRLVNNFANRKSIKKPLKANEAAPIDNRSAFSRIVFQKRNVIAVAAILAVGILHFAFQMAFIQRENKENLRAAETVVVPPAIPPQNIVVKSPEFEIKPVNDVKPSRIIPAFQTPRAEETAPSKIQPKKKDSPESRAERLRRAEKLLTGI